MQRTPSLLDRVPWSAVMLLVGTVLVAVAFVQAGAIPQRAHADFGALIISQGGSMQHSPTYPDTYRQFAAHSRMLQNAYLGLTGVALVTAGAVGVGGRRRPEG